MIPLRISDRVSREIVEEIQRDAGWFGTTRRFRVAYRFEVANYLGSPVTVELAEQVPVSELDDVKAAREPAPRTSPGYQSAEADGIVSRCTPLVYQ